MKTKQTIEKIERLLDIIKSNCNESVYMDAYLMSSDGHYDEKSGTYAISLLSYKNGSPSDAGVELNSLYDIAKAKAKELSLSFDFTMWDAMVYTAKAFSIHWATVNGDLETAVTIAVEDMAYNFGDTL